MSAEPAKDQRKVESRTQPRAPYSPPKLTVHGTLADLTHAVGMMGNMDGGMGMTTMSRP